MKSLALFCRSKRMLLYTQTVFIASRIEVNGFVSAELVPCPWPEVHRSCCMRISVCVRPGLRPVEWTRHSMDCSQIVAAYNARQSGYQVELSRISVSLKFECFLETNGYDKVRRYYFLDSFASRYLSF